MDWIIRPCTADCKAREHFFPKFAVLRSVIAVGSGSPTVDTSKWPNTRLFIAHLFLSCPAQKPFHSGRIVVGEKQAFLFVQSFEARHILF